MVVVAHGFRRRMVWYGSAVHHHRPLDIPLNLHASRNLHGIHECITGWIQDWMRKRDIRPILLQVRFYCVAYCVHRRMHSAVCVHDSILGEAHRKQRLISTA